MAEPQYGEPWRARATNSEVVEDTEGARIAKFEIDIDAVRAQNCVNLLARIPDTSPVFAPGPKSDEIQLALAVLAGDTGAAAALADEIAAKYLPTAKPRAGIPGLGVFKTLGEFLAQPDMGYKFEGEFKGIQSSTPLNPVVRLMLNYVSRRLIEWSNGHDWRSGTSINFSCAAGRALWDSYEHRDYETYHRTYVTNTGTMYGVQYTVSRIDVSGADIVVGIKDSDNVPTHVLIIQDAFQ